MTSDRTLPHDLVAERAVLGAILTRSEAYLEIAGRLAAADFFRDAHRRIFAALGRLVATERPLDLVTVRVELERTGEADEVGGPAYLAALLDGVPRSSNVDAYARIVAEKAQLRQVIFASNRALAAAYEGEHAADEVVDRAVRELVAVPRSSNGAVSATAAMQAYAQGVMSGEDAHPPLPTGHVDLDALLGGLRAGDLVLVAGRPSVGKSALGLGMARHVVRTGRGAVLFVTLEMGVAALASRLLAWRSEVSTRAVEQGSAQAAEYAAWAAALESDELGGLWLDEQARTLPAIEAACRQVAGLVAVVIDYVGLLQPSDRRTSRADEVRELSRGLQRLARVLQVPVVALVQLSRAPESRRDKRPRLSDLRESGALEEDADVVLLLFREEMHRPKPENAGVAEVIVAKQRSGPTGVVRLFFKRELAQFLDLDTMHGTGLT